MLAMERNGRNVLRSTYATYDIVVCFARKRKKSARIHLSSQVADVDLAHLACLSLAFQIHQVFSVLCGSRSARLIAIPQPCEEAESIRTLHHPCGKVTSHLLKNTWSCIS